MHSDNYFVQNIDAEAFGVARDDAHGEHVDVAGTVDGAEFLVVGDGAEKFDVATDAGLVGGGPDAFFCL